MARAMKHMKPSIANRPRRYGGSGLLSLKYYARRKNKQGFTSKWFCQDLAAK